MAACEAEDAETADIAGGIAISVSISCAGSGAGRWVVIGLAVRLGSPNVSQ